MYVLLFQFAAKVAELNIIFWSSALYWKSQNSIQTSSHKQQR